MELTRRTFIAAAALSAGALGGGLIGCTSSTGSSGADDASTDTSTEETAAEVDNTITYDDVDIEKASASEVQAIISGSDTTTLLIDARPQEAYSGWALEGAANGGHLKGALLFSARWLDCDYAKETPRADMLEREMADQGITSSSRAIVYDYTGKQAEEVAKYLTSKGLSGVKAFQANELIDQAANVEAYENHRRFVPAEIVKSVSDVKTGKASTLSAEAQEVFGNNIDDIVIVDVGWGNPKESPYFSLGHVPGAIHVNTDCYERPHVYIPEKRSDYAKEWRLISLEQFRDSLCPEYGITRNSKVIITCSYEGPAGRLGYMLRSLGVDTYVMTGHLTAWKYNGYELDTDESTLVTPVAVDGFGSNDIANPDEILWMDDIKDILSGAREGQVVDNRGEDEWNGESSGYSYHDLAGRIEGSIWCEEGENFENPDDTTRTQAEYVSYMESCGLDTSKTMAFFCGDSMGAAIISWRCQSVDMPNVMQWGNGWIPWSNEGNDFIDHNGVNVHYDKWLDTVVDEDGNDVRDGVNILDDVTEEAA